MGGSPSKIIGSRIDEIDGVTVIVFVSTAVDGSPQETMFPAHGLYAVFNDARDKLETHLNTKFVKGQEWVRSINRQGTPAKIVPTSDGKVLLIARHGAADEARLLFSPQDALALSEELRKEALGALNQSDARSH